MSHRIRIGVGLALAWCAAAPATHAFFGGQDRISFNKDIRPIFSENCFACHGPDESKVKAGLRLDKRELALRLNKKGVAAIKPGAPEESELFRRLLTHDPDDRMPPAETGKAVTPAQVELMRRWIAQGAQWEAHWAYEKPSPTTPPAGSAASPVDRFIDAKLADNGLKPVGGADPATLIRRLSFDLRGLPPSPGEVKAFLADSSPGAYERLVDAFLASPAYGERMAANWLDLIRYADTDGYHGDQHRNVHPYRDYVIRSFNANKPFDRFTREQVAGDLLPDAGWEQRVASGYNRMLMTTREGGAQPKEYMAKYSADRVRNFSTVWLGSTVGCSECHDHKFDPFTAKDFYSLAAFFADVKETAVGEQEETPIPTPEEESAITQLERQAGELEAALTRDDAALDTAQAAWEQSFASHWVAPEITEAKSKAGASFEKRPDGSLVVGGEVSGKDVYEITLKPAPGRVTALRLEALADDALPARGPGRAGNGNFVVSELEARLNGEKLAFQGSSATHSQDNWAVAGLADGKAETGWAVLPHVGRDHEVVLPLKQPADVGEGASLVVRLVQNHPDRHTLGRFRLSVTDAATAPQALPLEAREALSAAKESRSEAQAATLRRLHREAAPELAEPRSALKSKRDEIARVRAGMARTLVTTAVEPRPMRILPRGNWLDESGEVVDPNPPHFLNPLRAKGRATRVDLANWLVDRDNPLVSRVMVNRLWKLMFGQGLVRTADDFGSQGSWPTHLALLDWLSLEFVDSGWDIKRMLKWMAMSEAYQRSSVDGEALRQADPYNQWLARQNRFRLEAEMVRDNALAVSGLLVQKLGGPSVKPYQPPGYWAYLNFPTREWQHDKGAAVHRRGLYTYWCRTYLQPSLLAFDAPTREECTVDRVRSNTPQQALALLNDTTYVEAARALAAEAIEQSNGGPESRLEWMFGRVLSRAPGGEEKRLLASLLEREWERYRANPASADELLSVGEWSAPPGLDRLEIAVWTSAARVLLNLHETITRS